MKQTPTSTCGWSVFGVFFGMVYHVSDLFHELLAISLPLMIFDKPIVFNIASYAFCIA